MDIGTVDESQPVGARCCVQIRGVLCGRPAEHEATEDRLKAAAAFKRSPRNGKLTWDASLSLIVSKKRWVCGEHAFDLCQPCLKPAFYVASKNQSVDRRDFINAVVKVCEKVTPAPEALPSKRSRRHTTGELPQHIPQAAELPTPTVPLDEKQLMLWGLFVRVIPFITFPCFFFTYLVTAFRHVLSLNGKSIGGQVWHGDTYGEDVRNWSCCLYAIGSKATHIALTGGAIPDDTEKVVDRKFDLREIALPGIMCDRQVRRYLNSQWETEQLIAPSQELVDTGLNFIGQGKTSGLMVAVTVDCVYGRSRAELVMNLKKEWKVVGAGTLEDMVAAAWGEERVGDRAKLDKDTIATRLLSIVLQHFHSKRKCLISLVPLNSETGVLLSKAVLKVRRLVFNRGSWLIFAGGDGASPVREAWRLVGLESKGDATTDLRRVERVGDLPFAWSGDDNQHNTKGMKRDGDGEPLYVDKQLIRLDRSLARLRGFEPKDGSTDVVLSTPGNTSNSFVGDRKLDEVLPGGVAGPFHEEFSEKCPKSVVDPKDSMASKPAELQGQLGVYLRKVGLDAEAAYCDLIWLSHCCARAIHVDDGRELSPAENLAQMRDFVKKLTAMRDACEADLQQECRGAARLRGFISEELYSLFKQSVVALDFIIKVAAASDMSEGLRSTLPYSEANETFHGILRRIDLHLRISAVAKGMSKILAVMMLIADPARSWPWRVGVGAESCYQSRPVHKHTRIELVVTH